jgi:AAHS family 4-hydroxybenzoate transporter-like MFS transporter
VNALAATYYPTDLRSTGIGAALAVGRFGAILGPVVAAALMLRGWTGEELFRAAAVPAVVSTAVVLSMRRVVGSGRGGDGPAARRADAAGRPERAAPPSPVPGAAEGGGRSRRG